MWGLQIEVVGCLLPRPLTWAHEKRTETTTTRCSARRKPGLDQPVASPWGLPLPTLLLSNQSQAGRPPPATWASFPHSRVSTRQRRPPAALAARLRSRRALWCACALWGKRHAPRPIRLLCSSAGSARDVGGGAATVALVTGEARGGGGGGRGGGGGGTRQEDGECGGSGPSGAGRSPPAPSSFQAQGGALRLKPRRQWNGAHSAVWVLDPFRGMAGSPEGESCRETWAWGGRRGSRLIHS